MSLHMVQITCHDITLMTVDAVQHAGVFAAFLFGVERGVLDAGLVAVVSRPLVERFAALLASARRSLHR